MPEIIKFLGYVPSNKKPKTLGERIVHCRRLAGITQKELAHRLSVDQSTLARWERKEREPQPVYQQRIIDFLSPFSL